MSLKERISSPLEAGVSILDAHHLPTTLHPALEYASSRLAKKSLHLTLVVVRRDYHLPSVVVPLGTPPPPESPGTPGTPGTPGAPATPASARFQAGSSSASNPVSAIKQLLRSARSMEFSSSSSSLSPQSSPTFSPLPLDSPSFKTRWPLSPSIPNSTPPMTPSTASSTNLRNPLPANSFGMRLVHAAGLPEKARSTLAHVLQKAEKKFNIGSEWLAPPLSPAECGFSNQVIRSSVAQNQVLYSSEGLTLLSLDRLYSVKSALSSYTRTRSPMRLEDAVDELRRYILSNNGCKITKADLLRSYDWLNVTNATILELDRMYRKAYGGPEQLGGISGVSPPAYPPIFEPAVRPEDLSSAEDDQDAHDRWSALVATRKAPLPKIPALRLQTNFASNRVAPISEQDLSAQDLTARPFENVPILFPHWTNSSIGFSIDELLKPQAFAFGFDFLSPDALSPAQATMRHGPLTPNGYDDISPITRGEWGMLMVDNALSGRTVAIETF